MNIRDWRDGDEAVVDGLLDPEPDPLWAVQGHRLHGVARDGERWRRSWVADEGGTMLGVVTLGRNWVHPDRYSLMLEVAPDRRRRGVATALFAHARANRAELLPMSVKLRERDAPGLAMARGLDALVYLRSPCPVVAGADPDVGAWCAERSAVETAPLSSVPADRRAELFADMYRWTHSERSPVRNEAALAEIARTSVEQADLNLSSVHWSADRVTAVAFVFAAGDTYECVTETIRRDEPDGTAHLGATIARTLTRLGGLGASVEFDGHDSDPHLAPLVATLPSVSTDPLLLVTIDAPRGTGEPLQ